MIAKTHNNRSVECSDLSCPCHEWSARMPVESPVLPDREVDCSVSEAKNVPSGDSEQNSPIPAPCIARVGETSTGEVMRLVRWPFVLTAALLFLINMSRLGNNQDLRVWNDSVCAVFFVGYMICISIATAIRTR